MRLPFAQVLSQWAAWLRRNDVEQTIPLADGSKIVVLRPGMKFELLEQHPDEPVTGQAEPHDVEGDAEGRGPMRSAGLLSDDGTDGVQVKLGEEGVVDELPDAPEHQADPDQHQRPVMERRAGEGDRHTGGNHKFVPLVERCFGKPSHDEKPSRAEVYRRLQGFTPGRCA